MNVVVFGTGGMGREVHQMIDDHNNSKYFSEPDEERLKFEMIGFLDGNRDMHGQVVHELPVLGDLEWLRGNGDVGVIVAVGSPLTRLKIVQQIRHISPSTNFPSLIHPTAVVGNRVQLEEGVIICAGAIVTDDIKIGAFSLLNVSSTVGHDTILGDFVTFAPGVNVAGNVKIEQGCDLGINCATIQGLTIGAWSVVGAGSIVIRDLPCNVVAVGNPARVIKNRLV